MTDATLEAASPDTDGEFRFGPDPDRPGWLSWRLREGDRYNSTLGPMWAKKREDGIVVVRTEPGRLQGNLADNVHGGAILTQIDIAMFVCARLHGMLENGPAVTLDLNSHFVGAARLGQPLDVEVEVLRETGNFVFLRGLAVQGETRCCAFSGTIRKARPRPRTA